MAASVTDNFGNRDNLRAGERRSKGKRESSLILWGRRGTQAVTITSVTEVIEVIGYQLWRGVLWPYCLGMYRSFNPENCIRRHIREAYQDDESTLEISGIPVCQNDGISVGRYSTCLLKRRGDYTPALSLALVLSITQETRVARRDIRAR